MGASALIGARHVSGVTSARKLDYLRYTTPQREFLSDDAPVALFRGGNQVGKAQPWDSLVLTPTGWRKIGDIKCGDEVIAGDGSTTRVVGVFPQGVREVVELRFDDGATVRCDRDHLWVMKDAEARFRKKSSRYGQWATMTAGAIEARWGSSPRAKNRISIPVVGRNDHRQLTFPLDPYLLGVLLGDGCMRHAATISTPDPEIVEAVRDLMPPGCDLRRRSKYDWDAAKSCKGVRNPLITILRDLGLWGRLSHDKFIPERYMFGGAEQRLALLQGLMDTDGTINAGGSMSFSSASEVLARGVRDLVRSLGGKAHIKPRETMYTYKGERLQGRISYRVRVRLPGIDLFRLPRQRARRHDPVSTTSERVLYTIKPAGRAECVCISVDHPSHTYITNDYIVTHNTTALHADILHSARGTHPFQKCRRPPLNIVVLSESWEQMGQAGGFMEKLWDLVPKNEIDQKIRFDPGRGITGKPPRLVFVRGPGKGSVISFGTYRQGARRAAGSTVHRVYLDEPPPGSVYQELIVRVLRHNGKVRIGFTPVLDMPDQRYLRALVDSGDVSEHNPHLIEANCWPEGNPGPWLTQERIDRMARSLPEAVRAMRIEGCWDPVLTKNWLSNFDRKKHVQPDMPPQGAYIGIGIDHGTNAGKQAAVLFAAVDRTGMSPFVWCMDEAIGDGITNIDTDARSIHEMLERNGMSWRNVDGWIGDRPTGESRYLVKKSNNMLRKHLAYQGSVHLKVFPRIATPRKYHGSVEHGLWRMNDLLGKFADDGTPHFRIHPRAERFAEFCEKFSGDRADPLKDVGDAYRYCLEQAVRQLPSSHMLAWY